MTDDIYREQVLAQLSLLVGWVYEMKVTNDRMLAEHRKRMNLLSELIKKQNRWNTNIEKLMDHIFEEDDRENWWRGDGE